MFTKNSMPSFALQAGAALALLAGAAPAAAQYQEVIANDMARCRDGAGPAVRVTVNGVEAGRGTMRVQLYRGVKEDWLVGGRWIHRIQVPAKAGQMSFCMPVPRAGTYAIAVRHDVNGNGKTDISTDGGAMSNNPSINIFNLGKPSVGKAAFAAGDGVTAITLQMRYL